jgi:hypothetical protein
VTSAHAVAEAGRGGDLKQAVVLGGALTAGGSTRLEMAAASADGEVGDERVLRLAGAVLDELPVASLAADRHGLVGLRDSADLVELDQRGIGDPAPDGAGDDRRVGTEVVVSDGAIMNSWKSSSGQAAPPTRWP